MIRFGPAGLGPVKTAEKVLERYAAQGLKACEIAFTYSNYIKPDQAPAIRKKAEELDIELSIHGSYFINLNAAEPEKIEASKKRILDSCEIGELLGAKCVVFHPGFFGKIPRDQAYGNIVKVMKELQAIRAKKKWKIEIAPETMGKVNVFGSIDEISQLVKDTGCGFCIDFAHILARDKKVDYEKVAKLFPRKDWHVHFSGIIYGDKGEKQHRETEKEEWRELLKNLPRDKTIRIINESPQMEEDSVAGLKLFEKMS